MKKIVSLDHIPLSKRTGISTYCESLRKIFKRNIIFLTFYKSNSDFLYEINLKIPNYFILKAANYFLMYYPSSFLMGKLVKKIKKIDVLILHSASFLRTKLPNAKKILIMHQSLDVMMKTRSSFANSTQYLTHIKNEVDYFIVPTIPDKNKAINEYHFNEKKVIVIPHISRIPIINKKKTFTKQIAMIARLDNKQKAIDKVIMAMKNLPDWTLNVYGIGDDEFFLKGLVKELKLDNVYFHGEVIDITDVLDKNSIHVMSSNFEGFGITNIEALSRGLPLIIRNTFSAAEYILRKKNGVLIKKEWCETQFIAAINEIKDNYDFYSQNAILAAKEYQPIYVEKLWKELIETI